jgi:ABC transporter substrate binding protein (PQQ-dependent alcohol dehydrogenase system)
MNQTARSLAIAAALLLFAAPASAQQAPAAPAPAAPAQPAAPAAPAPAAAAKQAAPNTVVTIGYVELDLDSDSRWDPLRARFEVPVRPWGSAFAGAQMGVNNAAEQSSFTHVEYTLNRVTAKSVDEIIAAVQAMVQGGVHFVVVDLPADQLLKLSDAVASLPVMLFNVSAHEDSLRGADCRKNIIHVIPSDRMLTDAMIQYLILHQWKNILVLQGPDPRDQLVVDALQQSANQFGAHIVEVRPFVYGQDPTNREQNNVALLTGNAGYDVVYIADVDGEFSRFAQYNTHDARPIVGAAGLVASAYWWASEDQDGRQIENRFFEIAQRKIDAPGWAAWASVRTVTASMLRAKSTEYQPVLDYMLSDKLVVDGAKKNPMSIRPWDHQMRQSILLAVSNAVLNEAPIEGFLHATNDLDTLGVDQPNTMCKFPG